MKEALRSHFHDLLDEQVRAQEPLLRAYLRRRIRRREDIEDYVQDVYVRVLEMTSRQHVSNWQGFLRRIASNLLIDGLRRASARLAGQHSSLEDHLEHADQAPTAEDILLSRQCVGVVENALAEVSPVARSVFLLVRIDGVSYQEAAGRLGVDVKTAYRHVERVLALISRRLAERL